MIARLVVAWQTSPPVSNEIGVSDRCAQGEESDPALVERLNEEIGRLQRAAGGRLGEAGPWGMAAQMAPLLASAELSLACGLSGTGADRHVDAAQALFVQDRLPRLRRLLRSGWVEWAKLDWFVRDTAHLDVVVAHAVERMVLGDLDPVEDLDVLADPTQPGLGLPRIVAMTVPQLRAAIAAAIAAIDADAAERAARNARSARRVRCEVNQDGTATVSAELAVEAAAAVWNALTAAAKAAKAAGDPRSLDQLRADELLARATCTPLPPPAPGDTLDSYEAAETAAADETADVNPGSGTGGTGETDGTGGTAGAGGPCHACGQEPGKARVRRTGRAVNVSLTLPLSSYLGLAAAPGRLDGFGPVAAAVARQIIRDAARHPNGSAGITWRCVVVDDVHGTVLGVGVPLRVSKHDPPPRLADLVRTGEPTCCFPGCRIRARDCDLDHRIPYDPQDPTGDRGGGITCSCNLEPLCRGHHRLKTAGLIGVRAVSESEDPGVVPGSLEFTTVSGLRYRRPPTPATPPAADLDDPEIALAVAHAQLRAAQDADDEAAVDARYAASAHDGDDVYDGYDGQDRAWRRSLHDHARRRIRDAAGSAAGRPAGRLDPRRSDRRADSASGAARLGCGRTPEPMPQRGSSPADVQVHRVHRLRRRHEQPIAGLPAEADVRAGLGQHDLAEERAVGREDVDAVITVTAAARRRPQVAVLVAPDAVRGPGLHVGEHATVPGTAVEDVVHVDAPGLARVDDVEAAAVRREAQAVGTVEVAEHPLQDAAGVDPVDRGRQLGLGAAALVVGEDPVTGVGEPDRAVGRDDDVVGSVEPPPLVPVREHGHRAVVLRTCHPPGQVLAGHETALPVAGVAVGVVRRLTEHRDGPGPGVPAVDAIRRDVAEEQASVVAEPHRPLDPAEARRDPLDGGIELQVPLEARVEGAQGGVRVARGDAGPAPGGQRREGHGGS
jgi:hypothetical protein